LATKASTVWQIGKRYLDGGLERALFDASRPGKAPGLEQHQQQLFLETKCLLLRRESI
jgi:hypothetical protein